MRKARVSLLAALFFLLAACLISLPLSTLSALAAQGDDQTVYKYTKVSEVIIPTEESERTVTYNHYYVEDIEGGFGKLVKSYNYPDSYNIKAEVKSSIILEAFWQIANAANADISENYTFATTTVATVFNIEHRVENVAAYRYDEFIASPDLNDRMKSTTLAANAEFEVAGEFILAHNHPYEHYIFHFDIESITMEPITDGSLIYLSSYYMYDPETESGEYEYTTIRTHTNGDIFSTAADSLGYIVDSVNNGLPNTNYTMTFIYDGKAVSPGSVYDLFTIKPTDTPYTVQGKLDFTTTDGASHTLYTNKVTVQKHTLEMRINTTKDLRVGVGIENEFDFIFDSNNIEDIIITRSDLYFDYSLAALFEGLTSIHTDGLKVKHTYDSVGEKEVLFTISIDFNGGMETVYFQHMSYKVTVLADEPNVVMPSYEIDFSLPETAYAVYGGTEFDVSASINDFYGDEHFVTEISLSGFSLGVISTTADTLTLVPLSVGRSAITFTAVSSTAGEFTSSMIIEVIESTATNTEIVFDEEFNLTGSNVVARLAIDGVTEIVNYRPNWSVKIESGDTYVDVPFTVDDTFAAVLEHAAKGYYQFSVSGNGISSVETIKRVSDINMAEVAEKVLPYLALIMVLFIAIVIFLHYRAKKHRTLLRRLQKTQSILDSAMKEKVSKAAFNRLLKNLIKSMKRSFTAASTRDLETLGLYQNLCTHITKSIQICEAGRANSFKMGKVLTGKFMKNLKAHYVDEAVRMCMEIDESLEKFAKVKAVAVTVAPDSKKSQIPDDVKFKAMLSKFYHQGDDVDGNNRSGDDDRDDDSKTEG